MTIDGSLSERRQAAQQAKLASGAGGGGPHGPDLDWRMANVEADVREMKGSLRNLELSTARMEARIESGFATVATKADLAAVTERLAAHTLRLASLEETSKTTIALALSKTVGVTGAIGLFVSLAAIIGAAFAALRFFHII